MSFEVTNLSQEVGWLRTKISSLKAQLEHIWKDDRKVEFELTGVFIHRGGTPSFGHYFFYSRNVKEGGAIAPGEEWFKYNDEEVSEMSKQEVLKDTTGETANPYLVRFGSARFVVSSLFVNILMNILQLVFTQKGSQVVETVNRFDPAVMDEVDQNSHY